MNVFVVDTEWWVMDGRANYDIDSASILVAGNSSEDEAQAYINSYGGDTCIVKVETMSSGQSVCTLVDSLLWR